MIVVLNKVDVIPDGELARKTRALEAEGLLAPGRWVAVSAKTAEGVPALYEEIYGALEDYDDYEVALPASPESESLIAWLHENTDVLDLTRGNEAHVHFEAATRLRTAIADRLAAAKAVPLREARRRGEPAAESGEPAPAEREPGLPESDTRSRG